MPAAAPMVGRRPRYSGITRPARPTWHHIVYSQSIRKYKKDDSKWDVEHSEDGEEVFRE